MEKVYKYSKCYVQEAHHMGRLAHECASAGCFTVHWFVKRDACVGRTNGRACILATCF